MFSGGLSVYVFVHLILVNVICRECLEGISYHLEKTSTLSK